MIELKNVTFSVEDDTNGQGARTIIKDLNFRFEKGGFYAITGPNGGGKSTLAKLIMGINRLDSGEIWLDGENISDLSIAERAKAGVAYGFQNSARFKGTTFRDLLSIAAGTDDEASLAQIIARVGICSTDFLDKTVDAKLSGGEIKKIELATVIARNPKVAIYDEPDTGIDIWTIDPMVALLRREQREHGTTTIVVSHNRTFLEAADTLILIRGGKIAFQGDFESARPILTDLSECSFSDFCEGEEDVRCYR